jgi:hypothetical protein
VAQLGFTSSSEFFAWVAECNASRDCAVAEAPNCTPVLSEKSLAEEQGHHETATQEKALADEANEQCWVAAQDKALADEANKQRQAAAWEKALADEANEQCQAAARQKALAKDKRRQEESAAIRRIRVKCALLAAPLDAILAEIERNNIAHKSNERQRAAARDKALADEANELRQAAAVWEKALANKADKLRQAAVWEKALADEANKQRRADTREKALADEANKRRRAATRKKALADEVNKQRHQLSTTVDGQPQMACCRSLPRLRVGCCHGPRAPNPQEHLLHGLRHWPRAPNQSTVNGWA